MFREGRMFRGNFRMTERGTRINRVNVAEGAEENAHAVPALG
jgi:hypothetical protein